MPAVSKPMPIVGDGELSGTAARRVETIFTLLIGHADVAAQIPAAEILDRGRRVHRRGGTIGMSAANAADDNRDAAPAAMRNLTLRIGFVLLAGEADNGGLTSKNSRPDDAHQMLKRHLTLIFKVDISLTFLAAR